MSQEKVIPTIDEIRAKFAEVRQMIEGYELSLDATIDDYPIGRRERGKCQLRVERATGKGYRTIRTTTNKHGRWCAPKNSTYTNNVIVVVKGVDEEHQCAWLCCGHPAGPWGETHVYLQYANGASASLAQCWRSDAPRRDDHHYSISTAKPILLTELVDGKEPEYGDEEHHVLQADPTAEIAAWDAWAEELKAVRQLLLNVWNRAGSYPTAGSGAP
jgi:hypothetical protein